MTLAHTNCTLPLGRPNLLTKIGDWLALARQRRTLAAFTEAQLNDIGITANEARTEAKRAIWDVPANWRR